MGKTKNLDQLLKELNEMQMQFDNLKGEMVTKDSKRKKNQIKTELASDKIDNDFFKSLVTAPKINKEVHKNTDINKQLEKQKELDNTTDDLLFSLDIEHEEITHKEQEELTKEHITDVINEDVVSDDVINDDVVSDDVVSDDVVSDDVVSDDVVSEVKNSIKESKEIIDNNSDNNNKTLEDKIINDKLTKNQDLLNKEDNFNTNIQNIKSKKEIEKIEVKKNIDDKVSEKSFLSIKQKLDRIKKEIAARELEISNKKDTVIQLTQDKNENDIVAKKVLAPKINSKIERAIPEQSPKKINKTQTPKQNNKTKKRDTVDVLTIIILVLLIVLIITAWALLK